MTGPRFDPAGVVQQPRPSAAARALMALVVAYRRSLGPLLGPRCRFEPSCSSYALDAFRLRGAWHGTRLTVWRLLRCQPFGTPGYDPVAAKSVVAPATPVETALANLAAKAPVSRRRGRPRLRAVPSARPAPRTVQGAHHSC
ncbi:MAG TPA: membrane protein insertion efficiency factor YidD [Mycobacteriales bacterium]|jgi:hypothetical protein|nr:membrane protein insertion efficiency factor YidD [Mycobacteriales bacterium]